MEGGDSELGFPADPEDFFQPDPQPSAVGYTRYDGTVLRLGLVAKHALWAHHLWNGGRVLADMIERTSAACAPQGSTLPALDVRGKRVIEFGAGAALPSVVALLNGAAAVTACEYPEAPLLANIRANIAACCRDATTALRGRACGFVWGEDTAQLLADGGRFDVALLADLLANHCALLGLAKSLAATLAQPDGVAFVAFGHYRPWLAERDLAFFAHAATEGLRDEELCVVRGAPMFPNDPGPEDVRDTVHVHRLTWAK